MESLLSGSPAGHFGSAVCPSRNIGALGNDPIGGAKPPGLYRALIYTRPFEFMQQADKVVQLFEWGQVWRAIYTDGRPVPDDIPAGPY